MRWLFALLVAVMALAAAAPAVAGGFATAGVEPPPEDARAGETWIARVTVLQHGRTPLTGVAPSVTIIETDTGVRRAFPAVATDRPGVYEARVELAAGAWRYEVDDGFGGTHTFAPFEVAGAAERSFPLVPTAIVAIALAVASAAAVALSRVRRGRAVPALR